MTRPGEESLRQGLISRSFASRCTIIRFGAAKGACGTKCGRPSCVRPVRRTRTPFSLQPVLEGPGLLAARRTLSCRRHAAGFREPKAPDSNPRRSHPRRRRRRRRRHPKGRAVAFGILDLSVQIEGAVSPSRFGALPKAASTRRASLASLPNTTVRCNCAVQFVAFTRSPDLT